MFFCGDLASVNEKLDVSVLNDLIAENDRLIINLEGYISSRLNNDIDSGVFNSPDVVKKFKCFNTTYALANNHITDAPNSIQESIDFLDHHNFSSFGAGINSTFSSKPFFHKSDSENIVVLNAGWSLIGCLSSTHSKSGVNDLNVSSIGKDIAYYSKLGCKVILYLHWGIETELYPLPMQRKIAHFFIDSGAEAIIGCHSHCVQGHELYKKKNIFYSLGNFIFDQHFYFNERLYFPSYCSKGLVLQRTESGIYEIYVVSYDQNESRLVLHDQIKPHEISSYFNLKDINNIDYSDYINFFRSNRVKNKLLPVFKDYSGFDYLIKYLFVLFRGSIIDFLFKYNFFNR